MEKLWENFLNQIKEKTSFQIYESWFKPLRLIAVSPSAISIEAPSVFFIDWVKTNYLDMIKEVFCGLTQATVDIQFIAKQALQNKAEPAGAVSVVPKNINTKYVFNNFVVGSSNQFAHAACLAVSNHPGRTYNPLFVYGGVGL